MFREQSQNNPGAESILLRLFIIEEDGAHLVNLLMATGIKGPCIWILYKELYNENLGSMVSSLRKGTLFDDIREGIVNNDRFRHEWRSHNGPMNAYPIFHKWKI